MSVSRRTFLRVLGGAVVGAVVAPAIPLPAPVPAPELSWWASQTATGSGGALTLEMMREAFERCSRGVGLQPQYIITTREAAESYARMCGLVYDVEVAA